MIIYIDADAIPTVCRQLLIKTALRESLLTVFVANRPTALPSSPFLKSVVVGAGFDVADSYIVENVGAGDLVITGDIPLANDVLEKEAKVLTSRGEEFTLNNIKPKLNARDFMESLRGTGVLDPSQMGGQKPYSEKDKKNFADSLNKLIAKAKKAELIELAKTTQSNPKSS